MLPYGNLVPEHMRRNLWMTWHKSLPRPSITRPAPQRQVGASEMSPCFTINFLSAMRSLSPSSLWCPLQPKNAHFWWPLSVLRNFAEHMYPSFLENVRDVQEDACPDECKFANRRSRCLFFSVELRKFQEFNSVQWVSDRRRPEALRTRSHDRVHAGHSSYS